MGRMRMENGLVSPGIEPKTWGTGSIAIPAQAVPKTFRNFFLVKTILICNGVYTIEYTSSTIILKSYSQNEI